MTIADLVAAPESRHAPLKTLAHVEFQLRVLGLLCAAAAGEPTKLTTPGSLDLWSRFIALHCSLLGCPTCRSAAVDVADSVDVEIAPDMSVRQVRNQVFHGGPDPKDIDLDALQQVVLANAERIVAIYEHGHVARLEPFFITIGGELAALVDYSVGSATYWPRSGPATDVARPEILDELQKRAPQSGDRLLESFAQDIQRDLRGFAERDSIDILVVPSRPIVVRWDLRTSDGTTTRIDRFELDVDHARIWQSESGRKPYKAFLADICNWKLLKERLLEELEEQVELESKISEELFPDIKRNVPNVPAHVRVADSSFGSGGDITIAQACERIIARAGVYSSCTNLIILTGEAGSGKTHSLLQFARESLSQSGDLDPIAIYISSSGVSANSLDTLLDARMARTRILDKSSVLALCRAGLAILVIDGFDELLGFRTYDNPLSGLRPILDALRGKGTILLSARSSYSEARLRRNLDLHPTLNWPPYPVTLELLPWRREQLQRLTSQLSVEVAEQEMPLEIRQLLTTPFFCLAFAAWARAGRNGDFLQFVVEIYLQRERRKLVGQKGEPIFDSDQLADIFSEVAEMIARNAVPEISEEDLELAASQALNCALNREEKRRLIALCGMSAEWAEEELSFRFTHLAIAEQFLARQVVRLPLNQAVSLLFTVAISSLCATLIVSMWRVKHGGLPTELIAALQEKVNATETYDGIPGAISLGELWAKVYGIADGPRTVRRITVDDLELGGSGRVVLDEARIKNLTLGPGVELLLKSSTVARLDLSKSSGAALLGDSYKQIHELLTQSELATGQPRIKHVLGLTDDTADSAIEIDNYFKSNIVLAGGPIIVSARDYAPDGDGRLNWVLEYGIDAWQSFINRMREEGKITLEKVSASGRPKVRLRRTEKFDVR